MRVIATMLCLISSVLTPRSDLCRDAALAAEVTSAAAKCQSIGGEAVNQDTKQTVVNKGPSRVWAPLLC